MQLGATVLVGPSQSEKSSLQFFIAISAHFLIGWRLSDHDDVFVFDLLAETTAKWKDFLLLFYHAA